MRALQTKRIFIKKTSFAPWRSKIDFKTWIKDAFHAVPAQYSGEKTLQSN